MNNATKKPTRLLASSAEEAPTRVKKVRATPYDKKMGKC